MNINRRGFLRLFGIIPATLVAAKISDAEEALKPLPSVEEVEELDLSDDEWELEDDIEEVSEVTQPPQIIPDKLSPRHNPVKGLANQQFPLVIDINGTKYFFSEMNPEHQQDLREIHDEYGKIVDYQIMRDTWNIDGARLHTKVFGDNLLEAFDMLQPGVIITGLDIYTPHFDPKLENYGCPIINRVRKNLLESDAEIGIIFMGWWPT